jgi:Tfp pilus assembly protein PilF
VERIEKLTAFLQANPSDSFLKHALALEFVKLEDDGKARQLFEEVLSQDPGYIGSYYQLGKLLERNGDTAHAAITYEKGMAEAKKAGETHSYNELQTAYEDLVY